MAWQSSTINPTTTSPAADISKLLNDLSILRSVISGTGTDSDVPFRLSSVVESSGNVGIGTASPTGKLQVESATQLLAILRNTTAASYASLRVYNDQNSSARALEIDYAGSTYASALLTGGPTGESAAISTTGAYPLILGTNGAARMTLDSSGNVLVGTNSTTPNPGFVIGPGGFTSTGNNAGASGYTFAFYVRSGVTIGSITQSGTTAVLYNTTSDQRLKQNIAPADDAGSLLDAVQVRQFDWISDDTHQRYGFIAQELVAVVPEAVHQPTDPDDMMAVDYSKLVPLLVKEIQSLRARVAALES